MWERDRGRSCELCTRCGSDRSGQMVSMNTIWPSAGAFLAGTLLHLLPPFHPNLSSLHSTPHLPCLSDPTNFKMIYNYNFNFLPLVTVILWGCGVRHCESFKVCTTESLLTKPEGSYLNLKINIFCLYVLCQRWWVKKRLHFGHST